ncbi:unnamed protein product [Protopolystoma xenopodis]|uniref:Uncharacterized protein n=1 Tax=Protopolystoma xenopodis TaxID=117903 RepID=A0A448XIF3_9PLAT|nr:unnamed protein product [Protopolystoma xenopodis]
MVSYRGDVRHMTEDNAAQVIGVAWPVGREPIRTNLQSQRLVRPTHESIPLASSNER